MNRVLTIIQTKQLLDNIVKNFQNLQNTDFIWKVQYLRKKKVVKKTEILNLIQEIITF